VKRALGIIAVVVTVVGAAVLLILRLPAALDQRGTPSPASSEPAPSQARTQKNLAACMAELENRITRALTRVRGGEEDWHAAISSENLNAWLVHRLEESVRAHLGDEAWRDEVGVVRARIEGDALTIGARLEHEHGASIVWARLALGVDERGRFVVEPRRAYIGTTRVPVSFAASRLAPESLGAARLDLGDGREVVIRAIRVGGGRLEFAMRTRRVGAS